jgi:suppressor for copper-sensitivity B
LAFSEDNYDTASALALGNQPAADVQPVAEIVPLVAFKPEAAVEETPNSNSEGIVWTIINQDSKSQNLGLIILFSFIGGAILNLMPCVLPVVGLKIMSFVDQAGKSRVRVFMLNLVYSLGVMAVFMVLACLLAFAGMAWGEHSGNPIFIISMTSVVFVFALSLLGIWEIGLPGFIGSGKASELSREEGYTGAFAKGALTTVLSTPCSGPFLGPIFAYTISVPTEITFLIFACIGLGMASPYLVIGVFPKMIRFLPKPGNWMVTFKQLMGFIMLFTAVYLLYTLKDDLVIATLTFLIGLGVACWLIGRVPLTESASRHFNAWLIGLTSAGAIAVFSFMFLQTGAHHEGWQTFQQNDLAKMQRDIFEMQEEGTTVMVDFTADWCPTCQLNFANAINTKEVNEYAGENSVARRIVDWSDTSSPESEHIKEFVTTLGANSIPVLAIFPADQPGKVIVLSDLLDEATVLKNLKKAGRSTRNLPLDVQHTASIPH